MRQERCWGEATCWPSGSAQQPKKNHRFPRMSPAHSFYTPTAPFTSSISALALALSCGDSYFPSSSPALSRSTLAPALSCAMAVSLLFPLSPTYSHPKQASRSAAFSCPAHAHAPPCTHPPRSPITLCAQCTLPLHLLHLIHSHCLFPQPCSVYTPTAHSLSPAQHTLPLPIPSALRCTHPHRPFHKPRAQYLTAHSIRPAQLRPRTKRHLARTPVHMPLRPPTQNCTMRVLAPALSCAPALPSAWQPRLHAAVADPQL